MRFKDYGSELGVCEIGVRNSASPLKAVVPYLLVHCSFEP